MIWIERNLYFFNKIKKKIRKKTKKSILTFDIMKEFFLRPLFSLHWWKTFTFTSIQYYCVDMGMTCLSYILLDFCVWVDECRLTFVGVIANRACNKAVEYEAGKVQYLLSVVKLWTWLLWSHSTRGKAKRSERLHDILRWWLLTSKMITCYCRTIASFASFMSLTCAQKLFKVSWLRKMGRRMAKIEMKHFSLGI